MTTPTIQLQSTQELLTELDDAIGKADPNSSDYFFAFFSREFSECMERFENEVQTRYDATDESKRPEIAESIIEGYCQAISFLTSTFLNSFLVYNSVTGREVALRIGTSIVRGAALMEAVNKQMDEEEMTQKEATS